MPRSLAAIGCILPIVAIVGAGSEAKIFSIMLPLGLIFTGGGGLLFSNIEDPKQNTKPIYAAIITAIVGFSLAGWALVLANR